jgi:hypothetical protein
MPVVLWRRFRAHHHERACGRASWAGDRSFVDNDYRTSARTTVCHQKHLVLVALLSASCCLAAGACNAHRAFAARLARRSRRTLLALRARRSWWASGSRRTGLALFTRRPGRAGFSLWPLSAARYAHGNRDCNRDTFHLHAHTFAFQTPANFCSRAGRPGEGHVITQFLSTSNRRSTTVEVHEQLGALPDWLRIFQDVPLGAAGSNVQSNSN